MKKILEKIVAISLAAISLIFIIMLLIVSFNEEAALSLNNLVTQVLIIVFAVIMLGGGAVSIYLSFIDKSRVSQLLVNKSSKTASEVSIGCIKKLAKEAAGAVRGACLSNITVYESYRGDVTFKACLKIKPNKNDTAPLEKANIILDKVTASLELAFMDAFGLEFNRICIKLTNTKSAAIPTAAQIDDRVAGATMAGATAGTSNNGFVPPQANQEPVTANSEESPTKETQPEFEPWVLTNNNEIKIEDNFDSEFSVDPVEDAPAPDEDNEKKLEPIVEQQVATTIEEEDAYSEPATNEYTPKSEPAPCNYGITPQHVDRSNNYNNEAIITPPPPTVEPYTDDELYEQFDIPSIVPFKTGDDHSLNIDTKDELVEN